MRNLRLIVVLTLMAFPLLGVSGSGEENYRDDFGDGGYSGNDGSLDFPKPWVESGDDGSASSGAIHVGEEWCSNNQCAHIESDGVLLESLSLQRLVDMSDFAEAALSFDLAVVVEDLNLNTSQLHVQVMSGGAWKTVRSYGLTDSFQGSKHVDITEYAGGESGVRFIVTGGTGFVFVGGISIDRVEVTGRLGSTSTSSTSSTSTTSTTTKSTSTSSSTSTSTSTSTTSTTRPAAETGEATPVRDTTTTTTATTTTTSTTVAAAVPKTPPPGSGLLRAGSGIMADYGSGAMGDMSTDSVEVLGVGVTADFSMAVEVFEAVRWWVAGLALLIAAATIGLVDRRRAERRARHRA